MKRILLFVILLATTLAFAADGKNVSYKSGDETVQGILYTPAGKGPFVIKLKSLLPPLKGPLGSATGLFE